MHSRSNGQFSVVTAGTIIANVFQLVSTSGTLLAELQPATVNMGFGPYAGAQLALEHGDAAFTDSALQWTNPGTPGSVQGATLIGPAPTGTQSARLALYRQTGNNGVRLTSGTRAELTLNDGAAGGAQLTDATTLTTVRLDDTLGPPAGLWRESSAPIATRTVAGAVINSPTVARVVSGDYSGPSFSFAAKNYVEATANEVRRLANGGASEVIDNAAIMRLQTQQTPFGYDRNGNYAGVHESVIAGSATYATVGASYDLTLGVWDTFFQLNWTPVRTAFTGLRSLFHLPWDVEWLGAFPDLFTTRLVIAGGVYGAGSAIAEQSYARHPIGTRATVTAPWNVSGSFVPGTNYTFSFQATKTTAAGIVRVYGGTTRLIYEFLQ